MISKFFYYYCKDGFINTLIRILRRLFFIEAFHQKKMKSLNNKQKFEYIYKNNTWGSLESVSGEGSELTHTENIRQWLKNFILIKKIKNIVDAPCGDFNWMKEVIASESVNYEGIDIVKDVINENNKLYGRQNIFFRVGDILNDEISDCDLLIVRDFLFHLSYEDISKFFINIENVKFKFLLITSHISENKTNSDILTGDFRQLDMLAPPFLLSEDNIIEKICDSPDNHPMPRVMLLINKSNIPKIIMDF